jgi:cytochrome c556
MRSPILFLFAVAAFLFALAVRAQAPAPRAIGSMSQLMIDVVYPTSNAIFYIERTPPKTEVDWELVRTNALTLAESANLLMMPARARDNDKWMADAKLLLEAGSAAYKAAVAKDMAGILALNEELNTACVQCHMDYRPNYRRRPKQ